MVSCFHLESNTEATVFTSPEQKQTHWTFFFFLHWNGIDAGVTYFFTIKL